MRRRFQRFAEGYVSIQRLRQPGQKGAARNLGRSQAFGVRRKLLNVEQFVAARFEVSQQMDQGDLRSVANAVEHRLCREQSAHGDAVSSARQLAIAPDLDAVRMT